MSDQQRLAIVTGAASGLGRAFALQLAAAGWHVAVCDIDLAQADETLSLIRQTGGCGQVEPLDVTRLESWQELRSRLQSDWTSLGLLVNNAGVGMAGEVGATSIEDWRWIVDSNLWGTIYGCHAMLEWLQANPHGAHIINVSSAAAFQSAPPTAAYNVTKGAILSLSETLYAQLRRRNVGVTVVCPSSFPTNINKTLRVAGPHWRELLESLEQQAGLTADDVAASALRGMRRKWLYVVVPGSVRIQWYLKRLTPQWFLDGVARAVYRSAEAILSSPAHQLSRNMESEAPGAGTVLKRIERN